MTSRRPAFAVASLLALSLAVSACSSDAEPGKPKEKPTKEPLALTLGVYGAAAELTAWEDVLKARNESNPTVSTSLTRWKNAEQARGVVEEGAQPDVFMVSRDDLGLVLEKNASQPASELLDERGVDFGDRFSRDALEAMSLGGELQCMPWSINTEVIYVNTALINHEAMRAEGVSVPRRWDQWTMSDFASAAAFASRPDEETAGVYLEPRLEALAPFILSGGGSIFDNANKPTSLTLSSDGSREALESALEVLRDASLAPQEEKLSPAAALKLFKNGKLGMIAGDRSLVPQLRAVEGLDFDVRAMPRIDGASTTAEVAGLCISSQTKYPALAAALIADLVEDEPTTRVISAGYATPANLSVATSPDFKQRDLLPVHSAIFTSTLRGTWFPPTSVDWEGLEAAVAPLLRRLLTEPGALDLTAITEEIDAVSRDFLAPVEEPSGSGTPQPSPSAQD